MGQKVNPHGLRVGIIKDWDSRWFAEPEDFADSLVEEDEQPGKSDCIYGEAGCCNR